MSEAMTSRTVTDEELISVIVTLSKSKGYPPTVREIGEAVGIRSPAAVHNRLLALQRAGLVDWKPNSARTIKVRLDPKQ